MPPSSPHKAALGQFFTANRRVQSAMTSLVQHTSGAALEPSAGAGDLAAALEHARPHLELRCFEIDTGLSQHCRTPVEHGDFFDLARRLDASVDVVVANPPYVAWKHVGHTTRRHAAGVKAHYDGKVNLYQLFCHRLVELLAPGGEMVLITPKEWLYAASAAPLRQLMADRGALTHVIDCGEEKLFDDADVPAIVIFRFVAGEDQRDVVCADSLDDFLAARTHRRRLVARSTRWLLVERPLAERIADWAPLGDLVSVRVGLVTGRDSAFRLATDHDVEPEAVRAQLTTSRALEPFIWLEDVTSEDRIPPRALAHLSVERTQLVKRRIARFDQTNWWRYGAVRNLQLMESDTPRCFALAKTRSRKPFFTLPGVRYFSGGVLGLFLRRTGPAELGCGELVDALNSDLYRQVLESMGLATGDKITLQPSTLADAPFPTTVEQARELAGS